MKQQISYKMDGGLNTKTRLKQACGFDLCPKKYAYLANPALLEGTFRNQNVPIEPKSGRRLTESEYQMETRQCLECHKEYLLPLDVPICTSCRGVYQ
jgi:hypothetical protein